MNHGLSSEAVGRLGRIRSASVSSLHRESTDSLIVTVGEPLA